MTDHPDQFSPADDAALDRLLATADWPTPEAHAVRRLTRTVAETRRRPVRVRWWLSATAAAAAAALVGVCWTARSGPRPADSVPPRLAVRPPAERPAASTRQDNRVAESVMKPPAVAPVGRSPTAMERMLVMDVRQATTPKANPSGEPASVAVAPRPATATDRPVVLRAARQTLAKPPRQGEAASEQAVAARLAAVATPADWPLLRSFIDRPTTRHATLTAVVARRDNAAVEMLLRGVLDPSVRPAVLAASTTAGDLPTSALLAKFESPRMDERWAAAVILGRSADAETLARLATMAERGDHRRESIAALIASDTSAARALLVRVSTTREVAPHVAPAREAIAVLLVREVIRPNFPAIKS